MAIWQYEFYIIPCFKRFFKSKIKINSDQFDDAFFWSHYKGSSSLLLLELGEILKKSKSWDEKLHIYGKENSNRIDVVVNSEYHIESISFRVDMSMDFLDFLKKVMGFCQKNNLHVISEEFIHVNLDETEVYDAIVKSDKMRLYKSFFK